MGDAEINATNANAAKARAEADKLTAEAKEQQADTERKNRGVEAYTWHGFDDWF